MIKRHIILSIIIALSLFSSCDIINNDAEPKSEFIKVIANPDYSSVFYAVDVKQTSDEGFIILASLYNESNTYIWQTPYIIKTDEKGDVLWEVEVAAPYVNPVGDIIEIGGVYYFACMHETTLESHLLSIDLNGGAPQSEEIYPGITYPLAVSQNSDNTILVQGFNADSRTTSFSKLSAALVVEQSQTYPLIEDSEELLLEHVSKLGKQYPFFNGMAGNYYYFNGFYNWSFSLVFVNTADLELSGVMNGFRYSGAISSATNISAGNYSFSMFFEGNNYFFPTGQLSETNVASIESLSGILMPKLEKDAKVAVKEMTVNGQNMVVYASNTKNNQISFYFFNPLTGSLLHTKEISDTNPIEVNKIIQCSDGNIAITGRTFVSGQFSRVFITKISKEDL